MKNLASLRFILFSLITALILFHLCSIKAFANTWTAIAPLLFAPGMVNSATDTNGSIYAFGGNFDQNYNIAQKYNPNTNIWSYIVPMPTTRFSYASVRGSDGKIYIFGGQSSSGEVYNIVSAYDPTTNTWSCSTNDIAPNCTSNNLAPMPTARETLEGAGVLASDGKIYLFGGVSLSGNPYTDIVEAYDPITNTWSCSTNDTSSGCSSYDITPLPFPRANQIALGPDQKIYIVGGYSCSEGNTCDFTSDVQAYNVFTKQWTVLSPLPVAKGEFGIATGADGKIYVFGGQRNINGNIVETASTYVYDINTNTWEEIDSLPYPTRSLGGAIDLDGRIYAIGGAANGNDIFYNNVEILDTKLNALNIIPLQQTDFAWSHNIYDSATKWSKNPTIGVWGCALTSYAMILKYFEINKLPNGTTLDPGTLNTWLQNNNGYIDGKTSGFVNPVAISILSKKAKQINNITKFDALEYSRVYGKNNTQALTDSINHDIPAILDVGGHFVVATGINGTTFDINDPYYEIHKDLFASYPDGFNYFGKLSPSNTDLSYILITGNKDLHFTLKDSNNNRIEQEYLQEPLINDETKQSGGESIKMLLFPKPSSGTYTLNITGNSGKKDFQIYLYDKGGNLKLMKQAINLNHKSQDINIYFDKNNVKNNKINRGKEENEFEDEIKDWFQDLFN